jgi:hypothetical protein
MIYFDSCYIAKFYLAEPDSPNVIAFTKGRADIGCLSVGKAEVMAVFHRKLREGVVDVNGFQLLCDQFEADCASGLWHWHATDDTLVASLVKRLRALPATTFLRTIDGMHLTCAAEDGCAAIHTSDRHIIAAASVFGLQAVTL